MASACVLASSSLGCNAAKQHSGPSDGRSELASSAGDRVAMSLEAANPYFSVRVLNTKVCTLSPDQAPRPGIKKLAVELELRGVGATEVPANPLYATLVDDKGQRFESTAQGCSPLLAAAHLVQGESTRGWVTFDIPESSIGQAIVYQPALVGARSPRAELELR